MTRLAYRLLARWMGWRYCPWCSCFIEQHEDLDYDHWGAYRVWVPCISVLEHDSVGEPKRVCGCTAFARE